MDDKLINSTAQLYSDIDCCISELIRARLHKDTALEGQMLFKMESLMVGTLQQLSCIIEHIRCKATPVLRGWVARDMNNDLHYFKVKPSRSVNDIKWWDRDYISISIDRELFEKLTWEDDPIEVELMINRI